MNLTTLLPGQKTYIAAAGGAIGAVAMAMTGTASPVQAGIALLAAALATFVRSGQKTETAKQIAAVTTALAPIVAAVAPGAAPIANAVGEAAGALTSAIDQAA